MIHCICTHNTITLTCVQTLVPFSFRFLLCIVKWWEERRRGAGEFSHSVSQPHPQALPSHVMALCMFVYVHGYCVYALWVLVLRRTRRIDICICMCDNLVNHSATLNSAPSVLKDFATHFVKKTNPLIHISYWSSLLSRAKLWHLSKSPSYCIACRNQCCSVYMQINFYPIAQNTWNKLKLQWWFSYHQCCTGLSQCFAPLENCIFLLVLSPLHYITVL